MPSSRSGPEPSVSDSSRSGRGFLTAAPFAHRGLHRAGIVENSRAAWAAAIVAGWGIECDVRTSSDGVAMVFHDATLDRLTAETGALAEWDAAALAAVVLAGTDETIPTLAEMLALVAGRVPLLIELKAERGGVAALCRAVADALVGYAGPAAVMAFDPAVGRWFAGSAPARARGLVVTEQGHEGLRGRIGRWLSVAVARPHFVAVDIRDLPSGFARKMRAAGRPVLTWTVRRSTDRAVAAANADQIIFEEPTR